MKRFLLFGAALALAGCSMIPKYDRPAAPVPPTWSAAEAAPATAASVVETPWREFFTEPRLRSVIELSLEHNRDLRVATLAIDRAKAIHRIQGSGLTPGLGMQAVGDVTRIPEKVAEDGQAYDSKTYSVQVGTLAWELDLFGRIRSLKAAALEQYMATSEARRAAQVSLVAAVAATWLSVAADAENVRLSRSTLESQQSSLDLVQRSREAGISSDLDLSQARIQVESARAALARWQGQLAIDRNALDVLAGGAVPAELLPGGSGGGAPSGPGDGIHPRRQPPDDWADVVDPKLLAPGLPSDVLLLRPDILAAEHELLAANANIGAARAAFFPRISLTAAFGTMSKALGDLFGGGTRTWMFQPLVQAPLWAGGYQRANLKVAQVDRQIAVARYEKSIQVAFAEVGDGLALRATLVAQRQAQQALVDALADNHRLLLARYDAGLDGRLGLLVAQLGLFNGQQALVGVRLAEQANLITLYKALGGGA
ncbi:MAG: TolC family protein [Vicinamibacteria bacterium]|nr:TolC family protein [Vicinamibacteria bacterium]